MVKLLLRLEMCFIMLSLNKDIVEQRFLLVLGIAFISPALFFLIITKLPQSTTLGYLYTAIGSLANLFIGLIAIYKDPDLTFNKVGLSIKALRKAVGMTVIGWFIWFILLVFIQRYNNNNTFVTSGLKSSFIKIIIQWLFVGISEELLFRGYILTKLRLYFSKYGKLKSNVTSLFIGNVIFALYHIPQRIVVEGMVFTWASLSLNLIPPFLAGLFLSLLYLLTQNIWFIGFVHGSMNAPLFASWSDFSNILFFIIGVFIRLKNSIKHQLKRI